MPFSYENVMTATIQDSINEFCGPYCNPERNQLGFCPTACIPFCYPICNRPFLNAIPPISPDVVLKTIDHQTPRNQTGNDYHYIFPLFFLAMLLIGFAIFLCYAISKFAKSCYESRIEEEEEEENPPPGSFLRQELEPEAENPNGLRQSVINSITVFKFKKDDGFIEETKCSVCLDVFQENEPLRLLINCDHAFHVECIDTWLKSHKNCPVCRTDVVSPPSSSLMKQSTGGDLEGLRSQEGAETETGKVEFSTMK